MLVTWSMSNIKQTAHQQSFIHFNAGFQTVMYHDEKRTRGRPRTTWRDTVWRDVESMDITWQDVCHEADRQRKMEGMDSPMC